MIIRHGPPPSLPPLGDHHLWNRKQSLTFTALSSDSFTTQEREREQMLWLLAEHASAPASHSEHQISMLTQSPLRISLLFIRCRHSLYAEVDAKVSFKITLHIVCYCSRKPIRNVLLWLHWTFEPRTVVVIEKRRGGGGKIPFPFSFCGRVRDKKVSCH